MFIKMYSVHGHRTRFYQSIIILDYRSSKNLHNGLLEKHIGMRETMSECLLT